MNRFLKGDFGPLFLFLTVIFCCYFNSLSNAFLFDDEALTLKSPLILAGSLEGAVHSYRPLRNISYFLDWKIFGSTPAGFRIMSMFYHLLITMMVYRLLLMMTRNGRLAVIAALLFALHPIHVDAVSYISGRRDLLTSLFYLLSLYLFIRNYDRFRWYYFAGAVGAAFLSMASKEAGATIPLVWFFYIVYREKDAVLRKRWFFPAFLGMLSLFALFAVYAVYSGGSGLVSLDHIEFHGNTFKTHYLTALTIFIYYLKQTIFPLQLILDNASYSLMTEITTKTIFCIVGIVAYLAIAVIAWRKRYYAASFWLAFFVITLGPMLQIVPLHEIVAEHYLYLPSLSFCVLAGMGIDRLLGKDITRSSGIRRLGIGVFILLLIFFSLRTITRNTELKDHWTVFHADQKWRPLSFRALFTLGAEYMQMRFPEKAFEYYQKAHATGSRDETLLSNTIMYYVVKGDFDKATALYADYVAQGEKVGALAKVYIASFYMTKGECSIASTLLDDIWIKEVLFRIEAIRTCHDHAFTINDDLEYVKGKIRRLIDMKLDVEAKYYLIRYLSVVTLSQNERAWATEALAKLDLLTDIPEAITQYRILLAEKGERGAVAREILPILERYQKEVLEEGKYYRLDF